MGRNISSVSRMSPLPPTPTSRGAATGRHLFVAGEPVRTELTEIEMTDVCELVERGIREKDLGRSVGKEGSKKVQWAGELPCTGGGPFPVQPPAPAGT